MTTPPPAEPPCLPSPEPAGLGARLAAKLIDLTITAVIAFPGWFFFGFVRDWSPNILDSEARYTDQEAYLSVAPFFLVVIYEVLTIAATAWKGATPGKKFLNVQVVAYGGLRTPSALRAAVRWALPLVVAAPLVDAFIRDIPELANNEHLPALSGRVWWLWVALGWWLLVHASALWDSHRRGWHDKAADTIVIKAPRQHRPVRGHDLLTEWQERRDLPFE